MFTTYQSVNMTGQLYWPTLTFGILMPQTFVFETYRSLMAYDGHKNSIIDILQNFVSFKNNKIISFLRDNACCALNVFLHVNS